MLITCAWIRYEVPLSQLMTSSHGAAGDYFTSLVGSVSMNVRALRGEF